jgi:hypothetical protein
MSDKKMVTGWINFFKDYMGEFVDPDSTDVFIGEVEIVEHSPE